MANRKNGQPQSPYKNAVAANEAGEEWLPVGSLSGRYSASSLGRIKGPSGRILIPHLDAHGRYFVSISTPEGVRRTGVHRLVCEAFHGSEPFDGAVCRHLDDVVAHNRPSNLAWGTRSQNSWDAVRNGRLPTGERHAHTTLRELDVRTIRMAPASRGIIVRLSKEYGICHQTISNIRRGKTWKYEGDQP